MKIIEAILKGERVYQADPDDSEYWPFFVMVNVVEMFPPVLVAWWKPSL